MTTVGLSICFVFWFKTELAHSGKPEKSHPALLQKLVQISFYPHEFSVLLPYGYSERFVVMCVTDQEVELT